MAYCLPPPFRRVRVCMCVCVCVFFDEMKPLLLLALCCAGMRASERTNERTRLAPAVDSHSACKIPFVKLYLIHTKRANEACITCVRACVCACV